MYWQNILYSLLVIVLAVYNFNAIQVIMAETGESHLEVVFFDVGQGDSFLIKTPDGYNLLVDSGQNVGIMAQLRREIENSKSQSLQAILLTHPHQDHVRYFPEIIEEFTPEVAFSNEFPSDNQMYQGFLLKIVEHDLELEQLTQGEVLRLGCCTFLEILWPLLADDFSYSTDPNKWSTTFRLRYGKFSLFAGGDIGKEEEVAIYDLLVAPRTEVLKVNHHGSNTSTAPEFAANFRKGLAVIQVGQNSYGHPAPEVLNTLKELEIETYTNQESGTIRIISDGYSYEEIIR